MVSLQAFVSPVALVTRRPYHSLATRQNILACSASSTTPQPSSSPPVTETVPSVPSNLNLSARLLKFLSKAEQGNPLISLSRAEETFDSFKSLPKQPTGSFENPIVKTTPINNLGKKDSDATPQYDILVAGGTLGIIYATALQRRGWRVAVIERGPLKGREQEWNISRDELSSLVQNNVLTEEQLEEIIVTECEHPGRLAFKAKDGSTREMFVEGVLNVGVAPDILVDYVRYNFEEAGGVVLQFHSLTSVLVAPDCVSVTLMRKNLSSSSITKSSGSLGAGGTGILMQNNQQEDEEVVVTTRLLIDAMGAFSPIAKQSRENRKPDAVCITVGSCIRSSSWGGSSALNYPDIMASQSPINESRFSQYFWEAFPVGRDPLARTTYMFSYGSCDENRQTLTSALEDYIEALQEYQGLNIDDDIDSVRRILFGFFPSYYRSETPANVTFDRILAVGDAGGLQSPISFGGFGCCARHLSRISSAVDEALTRNLVEKKYLSMIQWYLPSLAVTGLFHKAMSVQYGMKTAGSLLDEHGINDVLWTNMKAMESAGKDVQLTFLRDVVTAGGLSKTLAIMSLQNPVLAVKLSLGFVGVQELLIWSKHFFALILYASSRPVVVKLRDATVGISGPEQKFYLNRMVDALTYGSGADARH